MHLIINIRDLSALIWIIFFFVKYLYILFIYAYFILCHNAIYIYICCLTVKQPDSGEMALDVVDQLVRSSAVDIVVVDSVAALVPRAELEGEMSDTQMGLQARLMSKSMRKITGSLARSSTTIIFINQLRSKVLNKSFLEYE